MPDKDKKATDLPPLPPSDDDQFIEVSGSELPEMGQFYKFESIGESLTGLIQKRRVNPARVVGDARFKEQSLWDLRGGNGELWTINGNFDLDSKLKKVRVGSKVRVTYVDDKDLGADINPMRIYKVEIAKPALASAFGKKA